MHVLSIGTTDRIGGAARVMRELNEALATAGDAVSVFVTDARSNTPGVCLIPRPRWRNYLGRLLATDRLIATDWILHTEEFRRADVIHCHNLHGGFFNLRTLARMARLKPVVWTLHDEWALTPHCAYTMEGSVIRHGLYACPGITTAPRLLWDNTARLARERAQIYAQMDVQIVTPSSWLKERAARTVLADKTIRHIPNGINTERFRPVDQMAARTALGLPLDKKIILFLAVGAKDNVWKGWPYTRQITERYRARDDILLLCVGNLAGQPAEPNVLHVGHVDGAELLSQFYSAADALLFTSLAENFPLVILEAMRCGLPIVSFDVGGVKEAVEHRTHGFIASYRDTEALATGLAWALSLSRPERSQLALCASARVEEQYGLALMVERYRTLYADLLGGRPRDIGSAGAAASLED